MSETTRRERFKVGDFVWVPSAGPTQLWRECSVCAGHKRVTLILGSGEHVELDCAACAPGYESPSGRESYHEWTADAKPHRVTGVQVVVNERGEQVTYRAGSENCYYSFDAERCYASAEDAKAACDALIAENEAEQERRMHLKDNDRKKYSWHAGYHLRQAKDHAKQAEYHARKATIMRAKAKDMPEEVS